MFCSECGHALKAEARFCPRCGAPVGAAVISDPAALPVPAPSSGSIIMMWILTILGLLIAVSGGLTLGLLMDFVALIIAFVLAASRSPVDKTNAKVKFGLEAVGLVIGFIAGVSQLRY